MKSKVKFSTFNTLFSLLLICGLAIIAVSTWGTYKFFIVFTVLLILLVFGVFYAPMRIEVDGKNVTVRHIVKKHSIPMDKIVSIEPFQPTMGAKRICGSSGFMGYWGIFREGDIGRYMAYHGKSSDCFLIKMKNGDKYVLGCENPDEMVNYIKSNIG